MHAQAHEQRATSNRCHFVGFSKISCCKIFSNGHIAHVTNSKIVNWYANILLFVPPPPPAFSFHTKHKDITHTTEQLVFMWCISVWLENGLNHFVAANALAKTAIKFILKSILFRILLKCVVHSANYNQIVK